MNTKTLPEVHKASFQFDTSKSRQWLKVHRHEYVGKWVVLDGDRLIGAGDDPHPIVTRVRAEGVKMPFVEYIRDTSEPFWGGWLKAICYPRKLQDDDLTTDVLSASFQISFNVVPIMYRRRSI